LLIVIIVIFNYEKNIVINSLF